jgi:hypothetical protein
MAPLEKPVANTRVVSMQLRLEMYVTISRANPTSSMVLMSLAGAQHVPAFHDSPYPHGYTKMNWRASASLNHQQLSASPEQGKSVQACSQPWKKKISGTANVKEGVWMTGQTRCNRVSYCATTATAVNPHTWLSVVLDGLGNVDIELSWTLGSGNVDICLPERQTEIPIAHGLLQAGNRSGNKHTQWQQCLCKSGHGSLLVLRTVYRSQRDETATKGQPLSDAVDAENGSQAQNRKINAPETDIELLAQDYPHQRKLGCQRVSNRR